MAAANLPGEGQTQGGRRRSNEETMVAGQPPQQPRRARGSRPGGPSGPSGPSGPTGPSESDGSGRRGKKPPRTGWKRFIPSWKIVMASMAVLAAGVFGMIAVAYNNTPIPKGTQDDAVAQGSVLYYSDGKTEIARLGYKRQIITSDQIAPAVKDAVVAIENKTFYEDPGISISGMVRSAFSTLTGQRQGASTITQQLARNKYKGLSQEVSYQRKIKEIFIAVKMDKEMTKEQILVDYLNTVNFGRAYGIEAAAQAYFGKSALKVTPSQAAYLAARIQTPAWEADAPALRDRFNTVVTNMSTFYPDKYGSLATTAKFPKTKPENNADELGGIKGYMVIQVLEELKKRNIQPSQVRSGGYKIVSTFDKRLMIAAKNAVQGVMRTRTSEFHTGLAAVNPKNGRVVAFYGGTDYVKDGFNEPFDAKKQAASAFKPYVMAAWLDAGYSLTSLVPGNKTVPEELPGQQKGGFRNSHNVGVAVDVVKSTAQSVNTAFLSMAFKLPGQLKDVKKVAEGAGLDETRLQADIDEHSYQFAIGSALVTPVEQAAGYSIFANEGRHVDAHVVQGVWQGGTLVVPEQKMSKQVIAPEAAADATVAMAEVLKSGTAAGKGIGRPAAGKTGTNNDFKEAWFVGYTPQLSAAVGMYREQCVTKSGKIVQPINANCPETPRGKPHKKYGPTNPYSRADEVSLRFEGAGPPTEVWRAFMLAAHEGKEIVPFPERADYGTPENLVEKPKPTPTPTPDDPFDTGDNPFDDNPDGDCPMLEGCDGNVTDDNGTPDTGDPSEPGSDFEDTGMNGESQPGGAGVPDPMIGKNEDE